LKILLLLVGLLSSFSCFGLTEIFADLSDDLRESTSLIRQNTRTIERVGDFAQECTSRINTDPSLISPCDSLTQKFNIDMGKFYSENQVTVEDLIYPYTLPSKIHEFNDLSSSSVSSTGNVIVAAEHTEMAMDFLSRISDIAEECASKARSYDISGVRTCMDISESLNSHLKEFNQNARLEFDRVLGMSIP
jgi:hypothetical protein